MKIKILNRDGSKSLYNKAINNVIKCKGDTLILAYGYISDSIIDDKDFISNIEQGFEGIEKKEIIIVGCKADGKYSNLNEENVIDELYDNVYQNYYNNGTSAKPEIAKFFDVCYKLKSKLKNVEITFLLKKQNEYGYIQYHKKIAIKIKDSRPVVALIGSSNLTIPAYQDNRDYNQEIDVLLWNSFDDKLNKDIMDSFKDKKKKIILA